MVTVAYFLLGRKALLMKNSVFFSKMAADRGISWLYFLDGRGYFGSLKWLLYRDDIYQ